MIKVQLFRRKGCAYERMTSVGSDLNTRGVTITERIMMTNQQTTDQPDNDGYYQKENWMSKKHKIQKLYFLHNWPGK